MDRIEKDMHFMCKEVGTRIYGSDEEKKVADYIMQGFSEAGLSVEIQEFPVDKMEYSSVEFGKIRNGRMEKLDVLPMAQSGFTDKEGEILELEYLENIKLVSAGQHDIKGKAVIIYGGLGEDVRDYRKLVRSGARAVLINDNRYPVPWLIADGMSYPWMKEGTLPVIIPKYFDVVDMLKEGVKKVFIKVTGRRRVSMSQNVIGIKEGGGKENIVMTAHHDSVMIGEGATDNATGVAGLLEIARRLKECPRRKRNIVLVSCGSEEVLSYGSLNFVKKHASLAKDSVFSVNFDSASSFFGENMILVTGEKKLASYVKKEAEKTGSWFNIKNGVSPFSDQFPLNVSGVPSIWFMRHNTSGGYFPFHSHLNRMEIVDFRVLREVIDTAYNIVHELSGDISMPFPREIQAEFKSEISRYHKNLYCGEIKK